MRYWRAILPVLAAAGISAPAAAQSNVYVMVGYTDEVVMLIRTSAEFPQVRKTARATQLAYYAAPSFNFQGVPIRLTETEFEIDCETGASRRLHASAYRDIGDRVGRESYSEPWAPIPEGMGNMRRLACEGLSPDDAIYTNLTSAVGAYGRMLRDKAAG